MPFLGRGIAAAGATVVALVALVGAVAYAGGLGANPANNPKLLATPIDDLSYDRATDCRDREHPGVTAMARWLDDHTIGDQWGIYRCDIWGKNSASVHAEARAIDWRLDVSVPREKRQGERLLDLLLEPDRNGEPFALARRMGVQGLIFNCRAWFGDPGGLGRYSHCYKAN